MRKTMFAAVFAVAVFAALIGSCASSKSSAAPSRQSRITFPLAIRMAEPRIQRFPPGATVADFGGVSGPNESLSASNAQRLIDQSKEWYINDRDFRQVVDIIEREVVTKLQYDWDSYYKRTNRSYQESLNAGVGICDVYAQRVKEILTERGYVVEKWSSSRGNHAWNHVIMPNGKILYVDATWYDNCYDNHPTNRFVDAYDPWYITYDKRVFEHGYNGTINMHGAWPDAVRAN